MGRQFHTTSMVTGLLISSSSILANPDFDAIVLGALVIVIVTVWAISRTRKEVIDTYQYAPEKH